jgi:hypothetical protein
MEMQSIRLGVQNTLETEPIGANRVNLAIKSSTSPTPPLAKSCLHRQILNANALAAKFPRAHGLFLHTSAVFYWVGAWDLLASMFYDKNGWAKQDGTHERVLPMYFIAGLFLCTASGMLYTVGGIAGSYLPYQHWYAHISTQRKKFLWVSRVIFGGMLGTMMLWVSIYSSVSRYIAFESEGIYEYSGYTAGADKAAPSKYLIKDLLCILYGLVMLSVTGTFFSNAQIHVNNANHCCFCWIPLPSDPPSVYSPRTKHLKHIVRSLAALSGQVCLWMGLWDVMEFYQISTVGREVGFSIAGIAGMLATGTFYRHIGLLTQNEPAPIDRILCVRAAPKALISLIAQLVHFIGFWTLIDSHWGDYRSYSRNIAYVCVGIAGLMTSPTAFAASFGVEPWSKFAAVHDATTENGKAKDRGAEKMRTTKKQAADVRDESAIPTDLPAQSTVLAL